MGRPSKLIVKKIISDEDIKGSVTVDVMDIDARELTIDNADLIRTAQPWGQAFLLPSFSGTFVVQDFRVLKEKHLKMRCYLTSDPSKRVFDCIAFNKVENGIVPIRDHVEMSFTMDVNEWKGRRTLQLMIDHLQDEDYLRDRSKLAESNEKFSGIKLNGLK